MLTVHKTIRLPVHCKQCHVEVNTKQRNSTGDQKFKLKSFHANIDMVMLTVHETKALHGQYMQYPAKINPKKINLGQRTEIGEKIYCGHKIQSETKKSI